ncbi:MAG TPA: transcription antitermination factor NusB [Candidatus Omnitrophota bacterium]|nr:transcription antitermination factor NusB [Candidatus Omnitrophota bacterium]
MRNRTQAREFALKILYQAEITRREISVSAENYWKDHDENVAEAVLGFSDRLTAGIEKHLAAIDEKISKYAANWQIKRMAVIDKNILRIGVFEMLFSPDIPPKVCINEAVELAKKYGDLDSSKFVNGILDKIHKVEIFPKNNNDESVG